MLCPPIFQTLVCCCEIAGLFAFKSKNPTLLCGIFACIFFANANCLVLIKKMHRPNPCGATASKVFNFPL
jgi:hypothetical protein